jgi:hypothetical protein
MGSIPAMVAKPRTSLAEAKRASVIEAPRNSLGHLVAAGLKRPTEAVAEDISAAAEVTTVEHTSAVAAGGRVADMSAAVAAVAEVVDVAVDGGPTFALNKTSYR